VPAKQVFILAYSCYFSLGEHHARNLAGRRKCSWLFEPPQLTSQHVQVPHQRQPLLREGTCFKISISAATWRTTTCTVHSADSFASHRRASTLLTGALGAS
jgi:hypothetical protein